LDEKNTFLRKSLLISYLREIEHVDSRDVEGRDNLQISIMLAVGKVVERQIQQI
jgi:hypothetical protein